MEWRLILLAERTNLSSLTLGVRREHYPINRIEQAYPPPNLQYASGWNPTEFINVLGISSVSHLVIDRWGSKIDPAIHVCSRLALKIPSLKSLRIRMDRICPKIFRFPQGDSTRIESIVINLSLQGARRHFRTFPVHCKGRRRALALYDEMVKDGTEIVRQISSLKMFKVMCYKRPHGRRTVMDCMTGIETTISGRNDWSQ
jgi:hypothetical protein